MRFAIDGTTGLLGRNLLFEILKQNLNCLEDIEIILLGKSDGNKTFEDRMDDIILNDGSDYLRLDKTKNKSKLDEIKTRLKFIDFDLTLSDLGISSENVNYLKKNKIDYFYHIAALTNFFDTPEVIKKLTLINFEGTKNLLYLNKSIKVKNMVYVGSVYHAGVNGQEILPNYFNKSGKFRNPYERTKMESELFLIDFARKEKIDFNICRISTISGRLIEEEIGSTSKYDVFYEWAKYFLRYKIKKLIGVKDYYLEPLEIPIRIQIHPESVMNIIPADYGAKLLYHISLSDNNETFYHLVNDYDISTELATNIIMKSLNIFGHSFVYEEPYDKTTFENMYYRTVGKIFTPYVIDPPLHYNNDNLQDVIKANNLKCPEMNEENFQKLIDYAVKHNFGIE